MLARYVTIVIDKNQRSRMTFHPRTLILYLSKKGHAKHMNLNAEKQTDLILLDFLKVFDKVNHSKFLQKLHYGMRGNALNWILTFLGNW